MIAILMQEVAVLGTLNRLSTIKACSNVVFSYHLAPALGDEQLHMLTQCSRNHFPQSEDPF
jgi:hypothetical protein